MTAYPAGTPAHWCVYLFLLTLVAATFVGCASTKVITEYDCADAVSINKDTTVWHFFWGLVQARDIRPQCDQRFNHLNKVVAKTTPGQVILSFITLGMVLPQKVSWCCSPYNPTPGTLGAPRPPSP
jgi:hypothetical protein